MSNELADVRAALVAEMVRILSPAALPSETVKVLGYEPRAVPEGQITVTVTPSNMQPDYLTFVTRIYCPFPDPQKGQERQEAVVALISDQLGIGGDEADWLDPQWQFGWNERLDLFMAEAIIATPRGMV